jgi:hypothetical protein
MNRPLAAIVAALRIHSHCTQKIKTCSWYNTTVLNFFEIIKDLVLDITMVLNLFEKNQITGQKTTSSFVDSFQKNCQFFKVLK